MFTYVIMNCFQRDSLKDMLRLSTLHGNNACTRNLGDRLRGCWQRKEWILSFLSIHTQRVLIHQNSSKIFDIDCCVLQGSCLGQILIIMYLGSSTALRTTCLVSMRMHMISAVFVLQAFVDIFVTWCAQRIYPSLYSWRSSLDGHQPTQDKR